MDGAGVGAEGAEVMRMERASRKCWTEKVSVGHRDGLGGGGGLRSTASSR